MHGIKGAARGGLHVKLFDSSPKRAVARDKTERNGNFGPDANTKAVGGGEKSPTVACKESAQQDMERSLRHANVH